MRCMLFLIILLSGCAEHYGPPSPGDLCRMGCSNPYAGFVSMNYTLYVVGVNMESSCRVACGP